MRCPYCTEEVAEEAIACPHCTRDLRFFQPIAQQMTAFQGEMQARISTLEAQVTALAEALSEGAVAVPAGAADPAAAAAAIPQPRPGHVKSFWPAYAAIGFTFLVIYFIVAYESMFIGFELHVISACLAFYLLAGLWYAFIDRGKHFGRYFKTSLIMGASVGIGTPLAAILLADASLEEILVDWEPIPAIIIAVAFAYITGCLIGDFLEARFRNTESAPYAIRAAQRAHAIGHAPQDDAEARDRSINRLAKIIEALGPLIGIAGTILTALVTAWLSKGAGS